MTAPMRASPVVLGLVSLVAASGCKESSPAGGSDAGIDAQVGDSSPDVAAGDTADAAGDGLGASLAPNMLLNGWPLLPEGGDESRGFSSFDRTGGNDDGFSGTYSALYRTGAGENVIVDVVGPGRLNQFWFTSGESGHAKLDLGRIRVYLDDDSAPRVEADANDLFAGRVKGFPLDLVFDNGRSTGGFVSWVRMPFKSRIRITTEKQPFFYNAQYESLAATPPARSWAPDQEDPEWRAVFSSASAPWDEDPAVAAGLKDVPSDYRQTGSGVIDAVVFEPTGMPSAPELRATTIELTWEDETAPAVSLPVDMFFGSGLGSARVRAVAFRMDPARYQNRFPMPFWKGFHIRVVDLPGKLRLRISPQRFDEGRAGHLRAAFREQRPSRGTDDFEYLRYEGRGKLVGTVLSVEPPRPASDKGWWEGDLRSYADDRRTPGIHGTGHEDDHFGGWSNEFFDEPFTLPLHGEPKTEILDHNGQYNGNVTMYRLWPGLPFMRNLTHSVEHGSENSRAVNYKAATFFYAEPRPALVESDLLKICDQSSRGGHGYAALGEAKTETLRSAFEGRYAATVVESCHAAHAGAASFSLKVAAENAGFYLRRMFDQKLGPQFARVSVEGEVVGQWFIPESNATLRWAERDFFVPARIAKGKTTVQVKVEPMTGGPPWDVAEYRALSVRIP